MATKKQTAQQKKFAKAVKKAKAKGLKPFTKAFGAFIKKELKK